MSTGHTPRTLANDLRQLDDLAAICVDVLDTITDLRAQPLPGRACPRCGGLRDRTPRPCDVCQALRVGAERAELIAEVEWLLGTDHPASIARRLGYATPRALARRLQRAGCHDLATRFDRQGAAA